MKDIKEVKALFHGSHDPNSKMCVMEAAAYVAGDPWSAAPKCVSRVITNLMIGFNDRLPDDETRTRLLAPLIPVILGTKGSAESEMKRSWMAFDWLVRECGPAFMDLTPALKPHAKALRDLGPIYDKPTLYAATPTINSARSATAAAGAAAGAAARAAARDAAWAAAGAAAGDAAWAAAGAAAGDAAGAAAWTAAGDAAWAAAWTAARAAARDAAGAALAPTVLALQGSATDLVKRMAEVERAEFKVQRSLKIDSYEFMAEPV